MESQDKGNFNLLKENPEELILLVDKHVRVQLIKNSSFLGYLHSIDPVSFSVILSVPQVDAFKTVLIPGHTILDITEIKPLMDASPPTRKFSSSQSVQELAMKKSKIISWLKVNLLTPIEDGESIAFGNARLLPPYGISDICTDNPMVTLQMKRIIEAMPLDFDPDSCSSAIEQ